MKKIVLIAIAFFCTLSLQAKGDLHLFSADNKDGKISSLSIEKTLKENGFTIGVRSEMNGPFKKQFKQTDFKSFTLMTFYDTKLSQDLVKLYPDAGVITPMGIGIYQRVNEDTIHVSLLTVATQMKILGTDDKRVLNILTQIQTKLLATMKKALPHAKYTLSVEPLKVTKKLMTKYVMDLDEDDDADDVIDEIEMGLDAGFNPYGFIVAAQEYYNDTLTKDDTVKSPFDFYKTYSICKLEVIYTVARLRPDAAAFAPCTTMVYKKKGENKVVFGFPSVYNWMSSAAITDEASKAVLIKAQTNFEAILKDLTE